MEVIREAGASPATLAKGETQPVPHESVPLSELVRLAAVDNELFARTFFPRAARQRAPAFHREIDEILNDPSVRAANIQTFRGSAKTTKLRIFNAKRVAYGLSKTILYVGASEAKATQSIMWLRRRIEAKMNRNGELVRPFFANTFGLREGDKWTETEIQINHTLLDDPIWMLGVGITSESIRGINFDDFRPDLIVLDDIITDENAATAEQREKIVDLVLGALFNSLAPATEEPNAKIVLLSTPQHADDVASLASKSRMWTTKRFGCWTPETEDLPVDFQESIWEARYPTPTLRKQKLDAIDLNKLSIFRREMEVKLASKESHPLRVDWLQYYDELPPGGLTILAIDPVPPPSPQQVAKNLHNKDFEAHVVLRRVQGAYYVCEIAAERGHQPNWSVTTALELARRWKVARIVTKPVAYERTLRWLLRQEMIRTGIFYYMPEPPKGTTVRDKFKKIVGVLSGPLAHGRVFVRKSMTSLISQVESYPDEHDDILDALADAMEDLISPYLEAGGGEDSYGDADSVPALAAARGCP